MYPQKLLTHTHTHIQSLIMSLIAHKVHIYIELAALWPCVQLSLSEKRVPRISPGKQRRSVRRADEIATFMCRLCRNSGSFNLLQP
jgi:hypothetical protein